MFSTVFTLAHSVFPVSGLTLVGGRGNFEGTVKIDDGTLCDKNFTDNDATVICRMMGFTKG